MTELKRAAFEQAMKAPDPAVRLWMVAGEDEGQAEAMAVAAGKALGGPRRELDPAALVADPARLADEAAALSLFGDRPHLFIRAHLLQRPDSLLPALNALFDAPAVSSPVVLLAGALSKGSPLRQAAAAHDLARLVLAWAPDAAQVQAQLAASARGLGLSLPSRLMDRIWAASSAHPEIAASELRKIALYLGAAAEHPVRVEDAVLDLLLPDGAEADVGALTAALLLRDGAAMGRALAALDGMSAIPLLRAAARSLLQLAEIAKRMADEGLAARAAVAGARPPVFWKERDLVEKALGRWPPARITAALSAILAAERAIKAPASAGDRVATQLLLRLSMARG